MRIFTVIRTFVISSAIASDTGPVLSDDKVSLTKGIVLTLSIQDQDKHISYLSMNNGRIIAFATQSLEIFKDKGYIKENR